MSMDTRAAAATSSAAVEDAAFLSARSLISSPSSLRSRDASTSSNRHASRARRAEEAPRAHFKTVQDMEAYLAENKHRLPHPDDIRHLVEMEYPDVPSVPTSANCDDSLLKQDLTHENGLPYQLGDWIERLGDDMLWHFEPVRRIVTFQDTPEHVWYKTSAEVLVRADRARCSEEGVKRQFGMRPHLWQQWALLKMEGALRFQEEHEFDFDMVSMEHGAKALWEEWLHHDKNKDFLQLFESKPGHVRAKLEHHMLSPFKHMDEIMREWDLEEARSSVYAYNSFLGSGYITSLVLATIQLTVPVLLLLYQVRSSSRFPNFSVLPNVSSVDYDTIFSNSWEEFCEEPAALDSAITNACVFVVYSIRVVPAVVFAFYETVGDSPTTASRMNSLRAVVWNQQDDTVSQKCGFKLERYFNSVYISIINVVMLFCIFLADNAVAAILSALSIEFVFNLDREVASLFWFDAGQRYIRAGILEIAIRGCLLLEHLESARAFCWYYDCDMDEYKKRLGGAAAEPIYDPARAALDMQDARFMNAKAKLWQASARVARKLGRSEALWQYEEQVSNFGLVDAVMFELLPKWLRDYFATGIFHRFDAYCAWSKWEQVLFLPRLPEMSSASHAGKSWSTSAQQGVINFTVESTMHPLSRFLTWCAGALMFRDVYTVVSVAWRRKQYLQIPILFLDGVLEWFSFIFVLFAFPAGLMGYLFLIIYCQHIMVNTADSWLYDGDTVFAG